MTKGNIPPTTIEPNDARETRIINHEKKQNKKHIENKVMEIIER